MEYRHERKYYLSAETAAVLRGRAAAVLRADPHSGGSYWVHNVYFDDIARTAYRAKEDGAFFRDKYRIRYYNDDLSFIRFEHKHKAGELTAKCGFEITREQYDALLAGEMPEALGAHPVGAAVLRLYHMRRLRPVVSFTYFREAFIHPTGNVRITFDSRLAEDKGLKHTGVVELKYTHFLPVFVSDMLHGLPVTHTENSKFTTVLENKGKKGMAI
jgi:hypothetical protein